MTTGKHSTRSWLVQQCGIECTSAIIASSVNTMRRLRPLPALWTWVHYHHTGGFAFAELCVRQLAPSRLRVLLYYPRVMLSHRGTLNTVVASVLVLGRLHLGLPAYPSVMITHGHISKPKLVSIEV